MTARTSELTGQAAGWRARLRRRTLPGMAFGTARRALRPAGARWRVPLEATAQLHVWARVVGAALGIGAVAGAGQLGVAYGLGLLRFAREFPDDGVWSTQLTWVAWCAALAGLAGGAAGTAIAHRHDKLLELGGRVGMAAAGGLGAAIVVPLTALPARAAGLAGRDAFSPALEASLAAGLGVCAGILTAVAVLSVRVVAVSVTLLVGLVWLLALISVTPSLPAGAALPEVRLAVLDLPALAGVQPVPAIVTAPVLALLVCGSIAAAARSRGLPPLQTAAATTAAPSLLALAYLIGSPGTAGGDHQTTPYAGALVGIAAGLLASLLIGVVRAPAGRPEVPAGEATGAPAEPAAALDSTAELELGPAGPDPLRSDPAAGPTGTERAGAGVEPTGDADAAPFVDTSPTPERARPAGAESAGGPAPTAWPPPAADPVRRGPEVEPPSWARPSPTPPEPPARTETPPPARTETPPPAGPPGPGTGSSPRAGGPPGTLFTSASASRGGGSRGGGSPSHDAASSAEPLTAGAGAQSPAGAELTAAPDPTTTPDPTITPSPPAEPVADPVGRRRRWLPGRNKRSRKAAADSATAVPDPPAAVAPADSPLPAPDPVDPVSVATGPATAAEPPGGSSDPGSPDPLGAAPDSMAAAGSAAASAPAEEELSAAESKAERRKRARLLRKPRKSQRVTEVPEQPAPAPDLTPPDLAPEPADRPAGTSAPGETDRPGRTDAAGETDGPGRSDDAGEAAESTDEAPPGPAVPKRRRQRYDEEHIDWISSLAGNEDEEPPQGRRRLRRDRDL